MYKYNFLVRSTFFSLQKKKNKKKIYIKVSASLYQRKNKKVAKENTVTVIY